MTWFKVDDSFPDHPKVFDLPDCAVALWVRAGAWCARNLTDGRVPLGIPARMCEDPERAVAELLKRGLWTIECNGVTNGVGNGVSNNDVARDGCYRYHDWTEYQPSKEGVERTRKTTAARVRRFREAQKQQVTPGEDIHHRGSVRNGVTNAVSNAVSNGPPDPSLKDLKELPIGSSKKPANGSATRGTRIPENFAITPSLREWAARETPGVDLDRETAQFADYWRSQPGGRGVKSDWAATWRTWMRRATTTRAPAAANGHRATSTAGAGALIDRGTDKFRKEFRSS